MDLGFFKKSIPTLLFLIVFSIIGVTVFYQLMSQDERLKIYNPIDINPRLVDISVKNLKKNHTISDFELTSVNFVLKPSSLIFSSVNCTLDPKSSVASIRRTA